VPTAARLLSLVAALVAGVALAPVAAAQSLEYPIEIEDARVGLPPGRFGAEKDAATQKAAHVVKRATWAPVYLDLILKKELAGGAKVQVECYDGDELRTTLEVPLVASFNGLLPGARLTAADFGYIPYMRAGDRVGECKVSVVSNDSDEKLLARPFTIRSLPYSDSANYVVLSLGSRLPGFDLPGDRNPNASARSALRGGRVEAAAITSVAEMPDQWLGYAAADLVVLTTGSATPQFLADLFGDNAPEGNRVRREALLEWVRRGGKFVVSVGSNAPTVVQYRAFQAMLPVPLSADPATRSVTGVPIYATLPGAVLNDTLVTKKPGGTFAVANLNPAGRPAARTLLPPADARKQGESFPVVVQAPLGLGRVTLVAIDLDQSPFLDYNNRDKFWDWLVREAGSAKSALPPSGNNSSNNWSNTADNEDEWAAALRRHVDTFDGVPVVSFGWVALFIILYTLLIGPVEYAVLKYVFKRLELTWVTFPLIVVSVSAAAYFTAYSIKGNDLKVNKLDVVDVDVAGGKVYGRAWFTVFSPRIDRYTVGVEPRAGWTAGTGPLPPPTVGWMGGGSGGSGSLVSSGYKYHPDPTGRAVATALDRVPIQVWSTKAFTATWSGPIDPGTPLVAADLFHPPGNADALTGSFVSNLPLDALKEPRLIYGGRVYKLPAIQPGQRVEVPAAGLPEDNTWFTDAGSENLRPPNGTGNSGFGPAPPPSTISSLNAWGMLFHERANGPGRLANATLRDLDQSWRVGEAGKPGPVDEAILVARLSPPTGPAEPMMTDPAGPSPTTLWLRGVPGEATRQAVPGTMRQETFVRVYMPVRPASGKK
jgi:hypothetical protein